ncbi:MAG: hypothetical protein HY200_05550 [Nitrospirae bacterium]|nr:hypothetical protein [Nitrospirota bacterium]MBI3594406.1 hypothetical protein [Nitrospirota bacterium]
MEYQHPRWYRRVFLIFSFFVLIFPLSLVILGVLPAYEEDRESYLIGGILSFIILMIPIEGFSRNILSSVALTRKVLIIRPGGIFFRFFASSQKYPFSDYLFYIILENEEPIIADIYNFNKEIQAHIYHPRIRHLLLRIAQHEYHPNFHIARTGSIPPQS